jgi:acyl-ACP--UDP-N-acetylglucosamine O-acyltransferase
MTAAIHPSAVVDPAATLGQGVRIGPFCVVGPDVILGDGVELVSHVCVAGVTTIGARTKVWPFASLGHQPQDLKYRGERTRLEIGADNMIREHVTMNPGTAQGGDVTRVGDHGLYMVGVHVGHDCIVGDHVILANNATLGGHVEVGDHAVLGGISAVHQKVRIGAGAMVGGMTGVEKDVIPYGLAIGDRARLAGLNLVGLKRRGVPHEEIHTVRAAYRAIPMTDHPTSVGVIAGAGALPQLIVAARRAAGLPYVVVAFEGGVPDWIADHPHAVVPFEKPGRLFRALRDARADAVVFAGAMTRPKLDLMRFDLTALRLAPAILPLLKQGDDALLSGLGRIMEGEGFRLLAAQAVVESLLAPPGDIGRRAPAPEDRADIARGDDGALAAALGAEDVGQGAVVAGGLCLGLETLQGTDAMLDFVARTPDALRPRPGVLYKGPKPGQDRRVDLPAIGPETLRRAAAAGLAGVAVRAGGVLVLGREACAAEADRLGLFLHGWDG